MSLFQKSVEKKYLNELNSALIDEKFTLFQNYFGNPEIQENIRCAKEEQFQEGFLRELFVTIFGYTLNPEPNFNLTTELKNISNSKKADGAILKNGDALAVIELKSTLTNDLDKIETQAFGYKNHHPKCIYVVTSNFEKLRLYIQNAVDHIDFDLFTLTRPQFELMWLCLAKENLLNNVPLKIKNASVLQEENITKKLYADYSDFRAAIFNNLVKNNPETDKLLLFKKTQKLLDRFLFIFFAEDRLLVPPNSITQIIEKWKDDEAFGEAKPLYETFKSYFRVLNTGRPKRGEREEIFAYNGGLFQPDEVLDNISIDDELLAIHTLQLSEYDFETDVDVNILGHIFEHSLGEIAAIAATTEHAPLTSVGKRKKDGIFYTPKYITKYIVENTIGTLCEEKRNELQLIDEEYAKGRKNRKKDIVRALDKKLDDYRNWLLSLTILDPACGSGAFLNQALEFLITEHKKIDELRSQLLGGAIVFSDITADILEKNIYGIDINEESVEIAKLSLWLRTAQKGRKLNSLSSNIKCGNSLIDNPQFAGEKAFNWHNEFTGIFKNGGFDVVIGNPPYVQLQSMGEMSNLLSKSGYLTYNKSADLYCLFYERGCQLIKPKGFLSYITSNKWLRVNYGVSLRKFLTTKVNPTILIDFPGIPVFADAVVDPHILILRKEPYQGKTEACAIKTNTVELETVFALHKTTCKFSSESWIIMLPDEARKLEQMKLNGIKLKDLPLTINYGIKTGFNEAFFIDENTRQKLIDSDPKSAELIRPMLRGRDISPYEITGFEYLISTFPSLKLDIENYSAIKEHLLSFGYDRLKQTGDKGARKKTSGDWFETQDSINYFSLFAKPKIMYPNMTSVFPFMYDETGFLSNDKSFILSAQDNTVSLLFLVAVFNSSLAKLWIWYYCPELGDNRREIRKVYFEHFPVPQANDEQTAKLEKLAKERIQFTADMQTLTSKFVRTIQRKFNFEIMTGKLQDWYLLSYAEFIKELSKHKVKLSLSEEAEWEEYFTLEKQKAQTLKSEIARTDKEIDQMVYELYRVMEEVEIVEGE